MHFPEKKIKFSINTLLIFFLSVLGMSFNSVVFVSGAEDLELCYPSGNTIFQIDAVNQ
jgi:hypothetical protein